MRRRSALPDPEVDHGLRELDAALAGEPTADPDLLVLVADVDAVRPQADAAFLAALDARVHAGFAAREPEAETVDWPKQPRLAWLRRPLVLGPAAVAMLSAFVVALAITSSHGGGEDNAASSASSGPVLTLDSAEGQRVGAAQASPPHPETVTSDSAAAKSPGVRSTGSSSSSASSALSSAAASLRKVERSASLTLTPAPGDVQDTADGVVRATQAAGGYVQESDVSTRDNAGSAQFTLRIPSSHLASAIAQLSKLAHVGALNQSSVDITAETNAASDRLQEAQAERKALLRALGAATTTGRISSLKARLADNRKVIAARRTELSTQQRRSQLATVEVDVQGRRGVTPKGTDRSDSGGPWSPGDALHDAGRVLAVALGVALIALAVLLPLALVAALALLAASRLRRHRRETALDASAP
jgi:hypothetical protein